MVNALVEGYLDGRLLRILWAQIGLGEQRLVVRDAGGGSSFWKLADRFNQAGRHRTMIGLADLEQVQCAATQLGKLKGGLSDGFKLRLAVRMLESWLMADRAAFASFMGVAIARIPSEPDEEPHPKRMVTSLARTSSKRSIREGLVPEHSSGLVGPEYTSMMSDFIDSHWDSTRARRRSPSLERACTRWSQI